MKFNKVALASAASVCFALGVCTAGAASAADEWTGPYIGATIGMSTAQTNSVEGYLDYDEYGEGHVSSNSVSGNVGINAGYNKQFQSVVFGVEVDANYLGNSASNRIYEGDVSVKSMESGLAILKLRAGLAHDNWLAYVTGGPAMMIVRDKSGWPYDGETCSATGADRHYTSCVDAAKLGLAIGGGVQAKLSKSWSVKGEYLYVDGPSYHTTTESYQYTWQSSMNLARVGLVYSF